MRCTKCCTPIDENLFLPELRDVVAAWDKLPVHIRRTITSLVACAIDGRESDG